MTLHEVLLGSKEIKRLIVDKSTKLGIPLRYVCHDAGVKYDYFIKAYIDSIDSSRAEITEKELLKILENLGITVRFNFIADGGFDHEAKKEELKSNYHRSKTKK